MIISFSSYSFLRRYIARVLQIYFPNHSCVEGTTFYRVNIESIIGHGFIEEIDVAFLLVLRLQPFRHFDNTVVCRNIHDGIVVPRNFFFILHQRQSQWYYLVRLAQTWDEVIQ